MKPSEQSDRTDAQMDAGRALHVLSFAVQELIEKIPKLECVIGIAIPVEKEGGGHTAIMGLLATGNSAGNLKLACLLQEATRLVAEAAGVDPAWFADSIAEAKAKAPSVAEHYIAMARKKREDK